MRVPLAGGGPGPGAAPRRGRRCREGAAFASAIALAFTVVGALIVARQPANPVGWLLCVFGLSVSQTMPLTALARVEPPLPGRQWLYWTASWLETIPLAVFVLLSLYYPDGRLPSPRWRAAVWLLAVAAGLLIVGGAFSEYPTEVPIANPVVLAVFRHPLLYQGGLGWWLILLAGLPGAASLVIRFVGARGMQRQQLKWLLRWRRWPSRWPSGSPSCVIGSTTSTC